MGRLTQSMYAKGGRSTGGGGMFVGFDEKDVKKEFEKAFAELENLHDGAPPEYMPKLAKVNWRNRWVSSHQG